MINLFINNDDFINNFNYIYNLFYHLNIKIKIIESYNDIINFIKINNNEFNEYIFYDIIDIDLFLKLKLEYNINIYFYINKKYDIDILNNYYNCFKYILISSNYINLLNYKKEKILLPNQFDVNLEYNINKINNIYIECENISNFFDNNKIEYKVLDNHEMEDSIIIFNIIDVKCEYIINDLILNGNYILVNNNEKLDYLYFNNLIIKYNNFEEILKIVNDIKNNFEEYKLKYINYIKYYKQKLLLDNKNFYQYIEEQNIINDRFGFIILRHVNSKNTNNLWYNNIKNIRKFYRNKIYIIDDNSDYNFIINDNKFENINVIQSIYHKRGEILPYYYLYIKNLFDRCLIIHDSVFINKYIDFTKFKNEIHYLWHFDHNCNNLRDENTMMELLDNNKIIEKYDEKKWYGCFGVQTLVNYNFIQKLQDKYKIFNLLTYIDNRNKRMNFERIFSVLCTLLKNNLYEEKSIYGDIHDYNIEWGYNFNKYIEDKNNNNIPNCDLIKIWNGR